MLDNQTIEQIQDTVYSLAASPAFARTRICFAAHQRGVMRSDDGGLTWQTAFDALALDTPLPATCIALSPSFDEDQTLFAGVPGGILRSTDGGRQWTTAVLASPPPFVSSLVLSPDYAEDTIIFAGTMDDGVFRSGDGGASWEMWNIGLLDPNILCLAISPDFGRDRTLYAGTESGIYCSRNSGRFWHELAFPIDDAPVLCLALSPAFEQDGIMFAGTEACGLARSTDRGQSWQTLPVPDLSGAINGLLISPDFHNTPDLLIILDDTLLVSRDEGLSWSQVQTDADLSAGLTSIVAPLGLEPDAPLLAGLVDGRVLRIA
jgi:photosystem II stability/assembly factor-like uncharacterized protein